MHTIAWLLVLLVVVLPAAAEVPPGVPAGLAAYYDFNALTTDTGSVRDRSGNGFDLIPVGTVTATDGFYGTAAGIADTYLQGGGNPPAGAEQYSISLWLQTAQPANNYQLAAAAWWRGGTNASGWNIGTHYAEAWADGRQGSLRDDSGWNRREQFRADVWNHLVVVFDGMTFSEYVNGGLSLRVPGTGLAAGSVADLQGTSSVFALTVPSTNCAFTGGCYARRKSACCSAPRQGCPEMNKRVDA